MFTFFHFSANQAEMAPRKSTAAVTNAANLAKVKETFRKEVIQLLASTPNATCVASMQENDVYVQIMEAGGENWVRKMTGDQKWFPVMARAKRARTEDEVVAGDVTVAGEEVDVTVQASTGAPSKKSKKAQVTPENRPKAKKTAATPQAPPRRQPRRSATTPTPLAGLNSDNLKHIEDDTKSCTTSVFDEQIGALLARGLAKDATEQEEMNAAREAERMIRLEERDELASLFDEMEVQSAFERGESCRSHSPCTS